MRSSLMIIVALSICAVCGPAPAWSDSPPEVSIYAYPEMLEISYIPIFLGDQISLIAAVSGYEPMTYRWGSNGDSIGGGLLLQGYTYSETGDYVITFEATDPEDATGRDTCFVSVVRLAVESDAWGRIKAIYR